uniref:Uncharacterized protein n=1 Tax=Rhizophora mucronata TaxID=61149 RepID=A0A2P2IHS9_RHIMU
MDSCQEKVLSSNSPSLEHHEKRCLERNKSDDQAFGFQMDPFGSCFD